jgi:hypothetical protein
VTTPGGGQLVITSSVLSEGNLIMSGSGGTADTSYNVLTSTDVTQPLANWSLAGTGTFDSGGNFSFTNTVDTTIPSSFFIIQVP